MGRGAHTFRSGWDYALGPPKSRSSRLAQGIYRLVRGQGAVTLATLEGGIVACAWLIAMLAGFEGLLPAGVRATTLLFLVVPVGLQLVLHRGLGLYGTRVHCTAVDEALQLLRATALATFASALALVAVSAGTDTQFPVWSTPPIAALLIVLGCGGIRFQERLFALERTQEHRQSARLRTVIVGVDHPAHPLTAELLRGADDIEIVGFVDDDERLARRQVAGLPLLGTTADLERICRAHDVDRIVIALPNASRDYVRSVVQLALKTEAQVKVLPDAQDLIGQQLHSLHDLDLADLLGREHAPVDTAEINEYLRDAVVLVTGAGGSIGSEIALQVAEYGPGTLVLLDRDETLLHDIAQQLPKAHAVLGDVRDEARLRRTFERFRPDVVFHAAAYKHVPILEQHAVEAAETNVLATWALANLAAEFRCRFVHISSDKAASPCSVLGATKRTAEIIVNAIATETALPFAAVRFGNVLGSRGSVVPTFFRQIIEGGPVLVTHPEMERFFMTIPEAVSLVLQAGAMAGEPAVFLLDMGQPIQIMDLARQMIRLAGLRPGADIEIEIVGMRPGERLQERLHDDTEAVHATEHPSISALCTTAGPCTQRTTLAFVDRLGEACRAGDDGAVAHLLEEYLRDRGVACELEPPRDAPRAPLTRRAGRTELDLTRADLVDADRRRSGGAPVPALLGGPQCFPSGLPIARPARPPLERVFARMERSYREGRLTNGRLVAELEECVAELLGVQHVVAVSSCTSGLMLTLQAVTEGDLGPVVLPSFTFSASAHSVAWNHRTPRFADCDPRSFQLDLAHACTLLDDASALLATHVFGAPCAPQAVVEAARRRGVPVVFDAAHAFGATSGGVPIGGFGVAEVFSLTPTKVVVAGEGGLVATNDGDLAFRLRQARNYGDPGDYNTQFAGLNARMSEFHAAMALESLETVDATLEGRRYLAGLYFQHLGDIPGIAFQEVAADDTTTYKDFTITVDPDDFGLTRDALVCVLGAEGIETRTYFDPPVHRQRAYRHVATPPLPATDDLASRALSLPLHLEMGERDVERVSRAIATAHAWAGDIGRWLQVDVADIAEAG
jgi:FlaA1/EpsC-like NDP-sugar epimerase/dTDP-4-amino-4,6-dideoxygalactose transaminase